MKNLTAFLLLFLFSCNQPPEEESISGEYPYDDYQETIVPAQKTPFPKVKNLSKYPQTLFLPTLEHKISKDTNAVYCVTLLYAWDKIRTIINQPLSIDTSFKDLTLLNNSVSFVNVLKPREYSVTAEVEDFKIKTKATFSKSLPFELKLSDLRNELTFDSTKVAAFGTFGYTRAAGEVIDISYYKSDDNFIIELSPTDNSHKIILFKSDTTFSTMAEMFAAVEAKIELGKVEKKKKKLSWKYDIEEEDEVVIPKFKFNIETSYNKLIKNTFESSSQLYEIIAAWQNTAFILDENGAEIISSGGMESYATTEAMEEETPHPQKMRFDKPFFVMLKRTDAKHPYFSMWVANTELMGR